MNLDEIEARANAATPGPWGFSRDEKRYLLDETTDVVGEVAPGSTGAAITVFAVATGALEDADFIASARTDVPALIARVRELEAECERLKTFAAQSFSQMIRQEGQQMRAYGLSYEGVRKVLREHDDGDISFVKLVELIRAAARAMAEDECAALRALLVDAHRELATIEAITVSPSGVDGLIELVNRIGQKLEAAP
jgi:hypothetical protein